MDKRTLKKFLIIIGIVLLVTDFIICVSDSRGIYEVLFGRGLEILDNFGELESIIFLSGFFSLILGIIIQSDTISIESENNANLIKKYKRLRILGCLPFIVLVCLSIKYAISGFTFLWSATDYGFEAFWQSFFIYLVGSWHLYVIASIIIIKSSLRIRSLNQRGCINKKKLILIITIIILWIAITLIRNIILINDMVESFENEINNIYCQDYTHKDVFPINPYCTKCQAREGQVQHKCTKPNGIDIYCRVCGKEMLYL